MRNQPEFSSTDEVPPAIKEVCEKVNAVSDGLPCLIFIPNASYSKLYPIVVVRSNDKASASQINAYLQGEKLPSPSQQCKIKHDQIMEAIHAAADYLPTIVFIPEKKQLRPVNLISATVDQPLKACYETVQNAQKTAIGNQPLRVK